MEMRLLILALLTVVIRLFENASVVILTGINPRPVAVRKRIVSWIVSLSAAILAMLLAPYVASIKKPQRLPGASGAGCPGAALLTE